MMATTHALVGAVLVAPVVVLAPEHAPAALAAGLAGGLLPDFDLYAEHRRNLHFPVYYAAAAVLALAVATAAPAAATVALAAFLAAAAAHSATDVLGGGLELRPWRGESERAVYSHYHGRWIAPRRWIRYDGAPEDLLLAAGAGAVVVSLFGSAVGGPVEAVVAAILAVSAGYALFRKHLVEVWLAIVGVLPAPVERRLPERFAEA